MACVEAKNISVLKFRIVKRECIPSSFKYLHCSLKTEEEKDTLIRVPAIAEWQQEIHDVGDHQTHRYMIALPAVEQGDYYLVVSSDSLISYQEYQSLDAAFIVYRTNGKANKKRFLTQSSGHVVDRITGQPMKKKRVTLRSEGYITGHEYGRRSRTDEDGYYKFRTTSPLYEMTHDKRITVRIEGYEYESEEMNGGYRGNYGMGIGKKNLRKILNMLTT